MHKLIILIILLLVLGLNLGALPGGSASEYQSPLPTEYNYLSRTFYPHTGSSGTIEAGHLAWDMPCPEGTEVTSPCSGVIIDYGSENLAGNFIKILDTEGYIHILAHLRASKPTYKIYEGKEVFIGELLGWSGQTGARVTGPHTHYQVLKNGVPINPRELLGGKWKI